MILVTGATGFVGRQFIARQLAEGVCIRGLIRPGKQPPFHHERLEWHIGDVCDRDSMKGCLKNVETVVHLAAVLAKSNETENETVNAEGTRNLVQLCRLHKVRRFVFMSAVAAKFRRTNAYGRSKKRAEDIVIASDLDYAILRIPLIIGVGSEEWRRFVDYVQKLPIIVPVFGNGQAIKRPIAIDDVIMTLGKILVHQPLGNRTWEIACRETVTMDRLIDMTCAALRLRKYKIHIPLRLSMLIAGLAELILGAKAPITQDIVCGLNEDVCLDAEKAFAEFGLSPIPLIEAIDRSLGGLPTPVA